MTIDQSRSTEVTDLVTQYDDFSQCLPDNFDALMSFAMRVKMS